jgi:hypothetical protein
MSADRNTLVDMLPQKPRRPRDPAQLAKFIVDVATGQMEDRAPKQHRSQQARQRPRRALQAASLSVTHGVDLLPRIELPLRHLGPIPHSNGPERQPRPRCAETRVGAGGVCANTATQPTNHDSSSGGPSTPQAQALDLRNEPISS